MVTKGGVVDGNWVQERLEEQFNVEIVNTKTDTWDSNEVSILVASNELPDTFTFTTGGMTPREMYEDGLTRAIPREMIEKYAPRYAKMLDEIDNGLGWKLNAVPGNPDAYTALTGIYTNSDGILWAPTLRMDWMENLGIEIPADAEPIGDSNGYERTYWTDYQYSLEELEEILRAFTFDDPDGNGQNDTYGMLPYNNTLTWGLTYFGSHGIAVDSNIEENGEIKPAVISESYKNALLNLVNWYEEGLIDPEWTTLDERSAWEKYSSGNTGYFISQRTYLAQESWTDGRAPQNLLQNDSDVKLLAFPGEVGPNGESGQPPFTPVSLLSGNHQISANVTDEELARYLQMYDFINHDPSGIWASYGISGEHSVWDGKPYKSTLRVKEEYDAEEDEMGFKAYSHRTYPADFYYWLSETKTVELNELHFNNSEVVERLAIRPVTHDLFDETKWADINSLYGGQLDTLVAEFRMSAITGEVDIEAEWDNYVQSYLDNGGTELIAEMEKAPRVEDLVGENPVRSNTEPYDEAPELPEWEDPNIVEEWEQNNQ